MDIYGIAVVVTSPESFWVNVESPRTSRRAICLPVSSGHVGDTRQLPLFSFSKRHHRLPSPTKEMASWTNQMSKKRETFSGRNGAKAGVDEWRIRRSGKPATIE
jgi:hypothetical protein